MYNHLSACISLMCLTCPAFGEPSDDPIADNAVPSERMRQVYDEVKTPFKYGIVIQGETNQLVDCASVFRQKDRWYMVYVGNTKQVGYDTGMP